MTEITVTQHSEQPTAVVRQRVPMDALAPFFSKAFGEAMAALEAQGLRPAGPPFGKYYGRPTDVVDVEAGFPVSAPITATGDVVPGTLPGGTVAEATHVGPYDTMGRTYADIERYIAGAGLVPGDVMWECYLSDPGAEPDPSTWRTQICWAVSEASSGSEASS